MPIDELPENLRFAVISHNHYDHLDIMAVEELAKKYSDMEWFVPSGMLGWMREVVREKMAVHEMSCC